MTLEQSDSASAVDARAWDDATRALRRARRHAGRGWQTASRGLVERARLLDAGAVSSLCRKYQRPVQDFLRRRGLPRDRAEDIAQGFFEGVLKRDDFADLDPHGSVGAWLRAGAMHHLYNERKRERRQKRLQTEAKAAELRAQLEERRGMTQERLLDRQRTLQLMERAWTRLRVQYAKTGRELLFEHLKSSISREETALSDAELCVQLGYSDSYVGVVRRRLRIEEFPAMLLAELDEQHPTPPGSARKAKSGRAELQALLDALT